jgi:hypothetical protein
MDKPEVKAIIEMLIAGNNIKVEIPVRGDTKN